MKRFRVISHVSVVGVGLMLLQSSGLMGAGAAPDCGLRIADCGLVRAADGRDPTSSIQNLKSESYTGPAVLQKVLAQNLAQPLTLASGDFDEDGVPDLVTGYAGPGGGILTLHRGNIDAIYPNHSNESMSQRVNEPTSSLTHLPIALSPFHPGARVFELPETPEFLGTGDFDADGHLDVVMAAAGSQTLCLLSGDGQGGFGPTRQIQLPGTVTALVTGEINRRDGLTDIVVGIVGQDGPEVLVFESPEGAWRGEPEAFALPAEARALALGQLDEDHLVDLAVAAGSELLIMHGRDHTIADCGLRIADCGEWTFQSEIRRSAIRHRRGVPPVAIEQRSFPFVIRSIALGDFLWDEEHRTDIALLAEDGTVHLLARGGTASGRMGEWASGRMGEWACPLATHLVSVRTSGLPQDDLVAADSTNHQLHVLTEDPTTRQSGDAATVSHSPIHPFSHSLSLDLPGEPVAVLPMRLNEDALSDLVILTSGQSTLMVALTAPITTFTVNSTGDGGDSDTSDGVCNDGTGHCTLRAAIEQANASDGADLINFNIPGTGVPTITPTRALPTITSPVTLDGTTQPGGWVELNGARAGVAVDGLTITAGSSVVRGLVINRFDNNGIKLVTSGGNVIEGNYIGSDVTGTAALGNAFDGLSINTPGNIIGGTTAAARNVISGNGFHGVEIAGSAATGNMVQGNYIGTNARGTAALPNAFHGVYINGAPGTIVGGTAAPARNVISGNWDGVRIAGSRAVGNQVQGNYIGTNAAGTKILGNSGEGVFVNGVANNTVGGTTAAARNVISGNNAHGILITGSGATGNQVQGNYIGTNATGTIALYNGTGVFINNAPGNLIGGETTGARNLISGNGEGIRIADSGATGNQVQGNFIGTTAAGTSALGNAQDGIIINDAPRNLIGGTTVEARNVISGNNARGVFIFGSGATGTVVQGNYIGTNATGTAALGNVFHGVFINGVANNIIAQNVISGNSLIGVLISGSGATGNQMEANLIGTAARGTTSLSNSVGVFIADSASNNTIGTGNTIAFNNGDGVYVQSGTGNAIMTNSIFANAGLGINLAPGNPNGDTPGNGDANTGANNLQNSPKLSEATMNGEALAVGYTVPSTTRNAVYPIRVEFFKADAKGQGQTFLGSDIYTATDQAGTLTKTVTITARKQMKTGDHIVATATDRNGNTSEFSPMATITVRQP